ncbi:MAG: hypothetical protein L3J44_07110, partial [Campylobacteraceae bacterium]|nr:hypothetical protein [Campylobacteraceae bacterium]
MDLNGDDNENNNDTDGIATFNFSSVANEVINLFPASQQPNLSVSFYHNINDGLLQQNEITNTSNYRNITSPFYEKIYIRVNSSQNIDCIGFGENLYIELQVEPIPIANQPSDKRTCADDINGTFEFDTSGYNAEILQGQPNVTLTYIEEDGTIHSPNLPNPFLTKTQTIQVIATNDITNDPNGPCISQTTFNMIVDAIPNFAEQVTYAPKCDDGADDTDAFDVVTQVFSDNSITWLTVNGISDFDSDPNKTARHLGWYIDLPTNGGRVINDPEILDGKVLFTNSVPSDSPC